VDTEGIPEGTALTEKAVSPIGETTKTAETLGNVEQEEPKSLTKEDVQQMIAEATKQAVAEAKDAGRRELQGQQDRNKREIEKAVRRAERAEGVLSTAQKRFEETDPDVAKDLELERLRQDQQSRLTFEQEEEVRQRQENYTKTLNDSLYAHLQALGIDPNDKRIDWAEDSPDYISGRAKFDASVTKIIKEEQQTAQTGFEKRLKELEAKMTQAGIEANSVETTTSLGVVAGSDAEFVKQFGSGQLPATQANISRYNKIKDSY